MNVATTMGATMYDVGDRVRTKFGTGKITEVDAQKGHETLYTVELDESERPVVLPACMIEPE